MNPDCPNYNYYGQSIFISLFLLFFSSSLYSSDFNIKLRKTDINDLKQQLLPVIENNITLLKDLQNCLIKDNGIDLCLDNYAQTFSVINNISEDDSINKKQIIADVKKKISKETQEDKIIVSLKKLIVEAESIKDCIIGGKNANELKDCIVKYK